MNMSTTHLTVNIFSGKLKIFSMFFKVNFHLTGELKIFNSKIQKIRLSAGKKDRKSKQLIGTQHFFYLKGIDAYI